MYAVFDKDFYLLDEVEEKSCEELIEMAKNDHDTACLYSDEEYNAIEDSNDECFSDCFIFWVNNKYAERVS